MSTLMFDDIAVPVARRLGEKYRLSTRELANFVLGFVEGYNYLHQTRVETAVELRDDLETSRERVTALWTGIIQALLVLPDSDPAIIPLQNALLLAQNLKKVTPDKPKEGLTL